jgi:hypothetical protein
MRAMAVLLAAVGAAGCATTEAPRPEEMGAAFGRVEYLEEGKAVTFGETFFTRSGLRLFVRPAAGGKVQWFDVEAEGSFYLPLPAGEHVLVGYARSAKTGPRVYRKTASLMAAFVVAKGEAIYIGDLRVETRGPAVRTTIVDQEETTRERVAAGLAAAKLSPGKRLMRPEQQPGRFTAVTAICGKSWGIECDGNHHGVRPLQPNAFAWTYPTVESLTPLLEWTPSSRSDVTYDVAVYESVLGMRASLLAYAEGLRQPRYTPPSLPSGERYQWTVRLRSADTVSSWSTTSQIAYFPVLLPGAFFMGGGSSSGQYFGFETPK